MAIAANDHGIRVISALVAPLVGRSSHRAAQRPR